ncbi:major facilitator superfamily protein, partial [Striga asiatica]
PALLTLSALAGNSVSWLNTASYLLAINNFPLDRKIAVGLSTAYVGLSTALYTNSVHLFAGPHRPPALRSELFLLLNALVPLAVCLLVSPIILARNPQKSRVLSGGFRTLFTITVLTGIFGVAASLVSPRVLPASAVVAVFLVLLLLPLAVPLVEWAREMVQKKCLLRVHDEGSLEEYSGGSLSVDKECDLESGPGFGEGEEIRPLMMLRRVEFWLYFFVYLFGATLGLVYLNNLGQVAESRGCLGTSSLVSLSSAFGFFGRLLPSIFDYFSSSSSSKHANDVRESIAPYMKSSEDEVRSSRMGIFWTVIVRCLFNAGRGVRNLKKLAAGVSTVTGIGAMMAPMCVAFFLLAISRSDVALYLSTAVIGVCTGAITSVAVTTTTELFGAANFGVNHNIVVLNIPIGSFGFGYLAAMLYNEARAKGEDSCVGQACYRTTFLIWGCLCVLGTLLAFVLRWRSQKAARS